MSIKYQQISTTMIRPSRARTTTATATQSRASRTGRGDGRLTRLLSRRGEMRSRRDMILFKSLCQHVHRCLIVSENHFYFFNANDHCSSPPQTDASGHKVSKAVVLQKSIDFIQHLSKQKKSQENDLTSLRKEVNIKTIERIQPIKPWSQVVALQIMRANYEQLVRAHMRAPQIPENLVADETKFQVVFFACSKSCKDIFWQHNCRCSKCSWTLCSSLSTSKCQWTTSQSFQAASSPGSRNAASLVISR